MTGLVVVTTPEEMPVTETIELLDRLDRETGVDAVGDRRQPRAAGAVRPPPDRGRRPPRPRSSRCSSRRPVPACARCSPRPSVTEARRRVGDRHLERLRDGIPAGLPVLYVPELFTKATGRRVVALVAKALAEELDVECLMAARDGRRSGSTPCWRARRWCSCSARAVSARRRIAAALGLAAAVEQGGRVLVLTVDPARRLADALGVGALGNVASAGARRGVRGRRRRRRAASCGRRCSTPRPAGTTSSAATRPTPRSATPCSSNPLYQNITSRFVHSHDYLAMEQLHDLHATGRVRPRRRRHAAVAQRPVRARRAVADDRVLRQPAAALAHRAVPVAAVHGGVEALLPGRRPGARLAASCSDIADFFVLFQAMEKGFVARAREVEALLGDARTTFLVVSTLETAPAHEAAYLARELLARDYDLGAIIANRVLPPALHAPRRGDERQAPRRGRRRRRARRRRRRRALDADGRGGRRARRRATCSPRSPPASTTSPSSPTREAERRAELAALGAAGARRAVARLRRQRPRRR